MFCSEKRVCFCRVWGNKSYICRVKKAIEYYGKDITADKVKATKIVFKPDKDLRSVLDNFCFVSYDKKMARYKGVISHKVKDKE